MNEFIESNDRAVCETMIVFGDSWNVCQDTISQNSTIVLSDVQIPSKRTVLKQITSVFDPFGLFAPVLLKATVFLQTLWNKRLHWDDKVEADDSLVWSSIRFDLTMISSCSVDRCVSFREGDTSVNYNLLCFCDASACAYAVVVFLHQTNTGSESKSDLIFS